MTPNLTLLTVEEVATILRVDPETVRRYARDGRLKGFQLPGGFWRFRMAAVDALLAGGLDADEQGAEVAS